MYVSYLVAIYTYMSVNTIVLKFRTYCRYLCRLGRLVLHMIPTYFILMENFLFYFKNIRTHKNRQYFPFRCLIGRQDQGGSKLYKKSKSFVKKNRTI